MTEEITHLRKSKPVLFVAGIIWAMIAWVGVQTGNSYAVKKELMHAFDEFNQLMLFLLVAMTYINSMTERNVFEKLRSILLNQNFSYKKLFWSHFSDLYELGREKFSNAKDNGHLPPENVFIIDLYTWDKIIHIVKDGQTSLLDILKTAKINNSKPETKKQSFDMHLDIFDINKLNLTYLVDELEQLEI